MLHFVPIRQIAKTIQSLFGMFRKKYTKLWRNFAIDSAPRLKKIHCLWIHVHDEDIAGEEIMLGTQDE